jgi:hypothetical protein
VRCACLSLFLLTGNAADQYATEHLIEDSVDPVTWTVTYRCADTGRRWLRDSPAGHLQGGGPPRLRQLDAHGQPVGAAGTDPFG